MSKMKSEVASAEELEACEILAESDDSDLSIYNVNDEAFVIIARDETWAAFLLAQIQSYAGSAQLATALNSWQDIEA